MDIKGGPKKVSHYQMIKKIVLKVKSNYFIVRPKVDQRAGLLSLPLCCT